MELSLSIVLPVHNAQCTLARDVHLLLDLLPDITPHFEILVVDDASTDQTEEIAHELALEFPQLRVTRHQQRQDQTSAVQTAVTQTTGNVVFVQDEGTEIRSAEIRQLWNMRHDRELVMARVEMPPRKSLNPHLLERLANWGEQLRETQAATPPGGIQMIRREAVEDLEQFETSGQNVHVCQASGPNFLPSRGGAGRPVG